MSRGDGAGDELLGLGGYDPHLEAFRELDFDRVASGWLAFGLSQNNPEELEAWECSVLLARFPWRLSRGEDRLSAITNVPSADGAFTAGCDAVARGAPLQSLPV